ncbi:MAG: hypothetical protein INQ03_20390 [Candidatus Heimdallarchaeota archaeon]|nr:hypothetical protein [Candidatus Heimdallarchaeota archaeon]
MKYLSLIFLILLLQPLHAETTEDNFCDGDNELTGIPCEFEITDAFDTQHYNDPKINTKLQVTMHVYENSSGSLNYTYYSYFEADFESVHGETSFRYEVPDTDPGYCGAYRYYGAILEPGETAVDTFVLDYRLVDCGKYIGLMLENLDNETTTGYFLHEILYAGEDYGFLPFSPIWMIVLPILMVIKKEKLTR